MPALRWQMLLAYAFTLTGYSASAAPKVTCDHLQVHSVAHAGLRNMLGTVCC